MKACRAMIAVLALLAVTGPGAAQEGARGALTVVASFSILGDFARRVGGDRVAVTDLVGADGDMHIYQPSPADARTVAQAKLLIVNGLGFEGWLDRLIAASGKRPQIVVATRGVVPRTGAGEAHPDPHAWQSVANAKIYVANIRDALIAADPDNQGRYQANAAAYLGELDALDVEIRTLLARIPPERRRATTSHQAFGYFADAYGIAFIALQGAATDAEPSAKDVATVIRDIRRQNIAALFPENLANTALLKRIAAETGAQIGGVLYADALTGPDGAAPNYVALMRHNAQTLAAALAGDAGAAR